MKTFPCIVHRVYSSQRTQTRAKSTITAQTKQHGGTGNCFTFPKSSGRKSWGQSARETKLPALCSKQQWLHDRHSNHTLTGHFYNMYVYLRWSWISDRMCFCSQWWTGLWGYVLYCMFFSKNWFLATWCEAIWHSGILQCFQNVSSTWMARKAKYKLYTLFISATLRYMRSNQKIQRPHPLANLPTLQFELHFGEKDKVEQSQM